MGEIQINQVFLHRWFRQLRKKIVVGRRGTTFRTRRQWGPYTRFRETPEKKKLVIKRKNGNEGHGNSPYATLVPAINPVFISQQVQATSFAVIPHLLFFVQAQLASGSCEIFL